MAPDGSQKKKSILLNHTGKDVHSNTGKKKKKEKFSESLKNPSLYFVKTNKYILKANTFAGILNLMNLF